MYSEHAVMCVHMNYYFSWHNWYLCPWVVVDRVSLHYSRCLLLRACVLWLQHWIKTVYKRICLALCSHLNYDSQTVLHVQKQHLPDARYFGSGSWTHMYLDLSHSCFAWTLTTQKQPTSPFVHYPFSFAYFPPRPLMILAYSLYSKSIWDACCLPNNWGLKLRY